MEHNENTYSPKIVLMGGGTGMSALAGGVADVFPDAKLTVVLAGADDGGSTGILSKLLGIPAVGDSRKVTSALGPNRVAADIFERRFGPEDDLESIRKAGDELFTAITKGENGVNKYWTKRLLDETYDLAAELLDLDGHAYGNLVLANLALRHNDIGLAVKDAGKLMQLHPNHQVIPVTTTPHQLIMEDGDKIIVGEAAIDRHAVINPKEARVYIDRDAPINPEAKVAIESADVVMVGPGSLFTSQLAVLAAKGVIESLHNMPEHSRLVAVTNLINGKDTPGMKAADYLIKLQDYTGNKAFNHMICNDAPVPKDTTPVIYDEADFERIGQLEVAIVASIVDSKDKKIDPKDKLGQYRSPVGTDGRATADLIRDKVLPGILRSQSRQAA